MRLAHPGRLKLGTEGGRQQDRQTVDPREHEVEELARSRIDPMQILKDHQHRLRSGQPFELPQQRRKGALLFALWAQLEWRETIAAGHRQQLDEQGHVADLGCRSEQRRQFIQFCLRPVVALETGGTFELNDHRIERAVLVMRRAEIAQAGMRLGSDVLGKRRGEPRLADARLAGNQHHASLAALRLLPAAQQQLDFLLAPDERRLARAQGLEAAQHRRSRQDPPGALRLGEAGKRLRAEICELEQPADLPARRFADDQRIGCGQRLQPGGEVRRLADDAALLCRALADQIADHGEAGGDAEPHPQILSCRQSADRLDHRQASAHRALRVVLMRLRIAEIDQHPVAHVLGDKAVEAADRIGHGAVVVPDQLAQILRVKTRRQRRRADEVAEHHRQLPAFSFGGRQCVWGSHRRGGGWNPGAERGNGIEQPSAIADYRDAEIL